MYEHETPASDPLYWIRTREMSYIWLACTWRFHDWVKRKYKKFHLDAAEKYVTEYLNLRASEAEDPWIIHMEAVAISKVLRVPVSHFGCTLPSWIVNEPENMMTLDDYIRDRTKKAYTIAEQDIAPGFWVARHGYDMILDTRSEESLSPAIFLTKDTCSKTVMSRFAHMGKSIELAGEKDWARFYNWKDSDEVAALVSVIRACDIERFNRMYLLQAERQIIINSFNLSNLGTIYEFPEYEFPIDSLSRIYNSIFASTSRPWITNNNLQLMERDLPF